MINEERFWEASIAEAVSKEAPPDVTGKVLKELAVKEEAPPKRRGRLHVLRWGLELAAAAVVVIGIGLATGIIKLPGGGDGDEVLPPREFAAAPGAEYEIKDDVLELKQGWLLVTTGAPTVVCEGSELSKVDGRVLIHAGSMPTGERPESVENWLKANNVETDMVNNIKHWVKGVGLATLVLSGTAMLDGQEIKAPEPAPQSTAEWHVVRSVMDIDNLPKGVKHVNADGLDAAHLDFLAEVESLEAISLRHARGLRPEHLKSLKGLKKLTWIDIRGTSWQVDFDEMSVEALQEFPSLKRVGVDLFPADIELGRQRDYSVEDFFLPVLKTLSQAGVEIELGVWRYPDDEGLRSVLAALPTLRGMALDYADSGEMKLLAEHERLRRLELTNYRGGEIGLAYLVRKSAIEGLSIAKDHLDLNDVHQISQMSSVRRLSLDGVLTGSPDQCFEKLSGMKQLRELELRNLGLGKEALPAFSKFKGREPLDRLFIGYDVLIDHAHGIDIMIAQQIPTRRLEVTEYYPTFRRLSEVDENLRKGDAAEHLTSLRLELRHAEFGTDYAETAHAELFKAYTNLSRIEVRRGGFDAPVEEDQFVRWLKTHLPDVEVVVTP